MNIMNRYLTYIQSLLLIFLGIAVFTACSDEVDTVTLDVPHLPGLYACLSFGSDKTQPAEISTRADYITGEDEWGENAVASVDYYLFNANGERMLYSRHQPDGRSELLTTGTSTSNGVTYRTTGLHPISVGNEWSTLCTQITGGCRLYAIVNLDETAARSIASLVDLQKLVVTEEDIYLRKADKLFLMDGVHAFSGNEGYSAQQTYSVTVDVYRAAAKVKVNISKGSGWAATENNATIGVITASVKNYATNTRVTADAIPLTTTADAEGKALDLRSVAHDAANKVTAYGTPSGNYLGSVIFYTFAHNWTEDTDEETSLELNVPYTERPNNYYKLVFLPNGGAKLDRNTFYEVDVTIKYDGSERSSDPVELKNQTWRVQPWGKESFNVVEQQMVDYLILSDYYIDLRNEDHTSITFYSSDVVNVELASFEDEEMLQNTFNANQTTTILESLTNAGFKKYEGHPHTDMLEIPAVYYVNKDNERIDITQDPKANYDEVDAVSYTQSGVTTVRPTSLPDGYEVYVTWPSNVATQGEIEVFSRIPQNVTPRYITLKVTMKTRQTDNDGNPVYLTRYAVIKQYPLEYINGREGMLSYMESKTKKKDNPGEYYSYECPAPSGQLFLTYDNGTTNTGYAYMVMPDVIRKYFNGEVEGTTTDYHVGAGANMKCKFYIPYEDVDEYGHDWSSWKTKFGKWTDAEGTHYGRIYRIDDRFSKDLSEYNWSIYKGTEHEKEYTRDDIDTDKAPGLMDNGVANNNRMYEVVVTATSTKYRISRPLMENITDDDGNTETAADQKVAVSSAENNALLSPRFMLASQLGNNSAVLYWETARDQCKKYVEIGRDGKVYNDWRLPTIAELEIVKNYQIDEDVYDITMNKVLNSDGDTNPCYWTAQEDVFVYTTGSGKADNQVYMDEQTRYTYRTSKEYEDKYIRTTNVYRSPEGQNVWTLHSTKDEDNKSLDSEHAADGTEYVISTKTHIPSLAIRVRCVRDVKVEEVAIYD